MSNESRRPFVSEEVLLAEIRQLEESLHTAEVRASQTRLAGLLANDFIEVGSSGRTYDKATILAELTEEQQKGRAGLVKASEYRRRELGSDLALLTYLSERHGQDGSVRRSRRSSLWRRSDGSWQMIFHQGTPIGTGS